MNQVDQLLMDRPAFHASGSACHGLSNEALRFLHEHVNAESRTLETGNGMSTVLFAMARCHHTCISPIQSEVERIKQYCAAHGISPDGIRFCVDFSENVLPGLALEPLDFVLIDGGHGFPVPFLDWFYAGRMMKPGGLLLVDDTQLWTGRVLRQFLLDEPGWEWVGELGLRTAVFRKREGCKDRAEWCNQPFAVKKQRWLNVAYDLKTIGARLRKGQFSNLLCDFKSRLNKYIHGRARI